MLHNSFPFNSCLLYLEVGTFWTFGISRKLWTCPSYPRCRRWAVCLTRSTPNRPTSPEQARLEPPVTDILCGKNLYHTNQGGEKGWGIQVGSSVFVFRGWRNRFIYYLFCILDGIKLENRIEKSPDITIVRRNCFFFNVTYIKLHTPQCVLWGTYQYSELCLWTLFGTKSCLS